MSCDCEVRLPYHELSDEQVAQQTELLASTFVGIPTVIGAPLLMAEEVWREIARHQLELGVRLCSCVPAIKHYTPPTPEQALDVGSAAGTWQYVAGQETETPRERMIRRAREQRAEYLAEVARRRASGDLPPAP